MSQPDLFGAPAEKPDLRKALERTLRWTYGCMERHATAERFEVQADWSHYYVDDLRTIRLALGKSVEMHVVEVSGPADIDDPVTAGPDEQPVTVTDGSRG